jgi:hypothetical protein
MAWWQITLILGGSVIVGLGIGLLVNYVIKRFIKKPYVSVGRRDLTIAAQEHRQFTEPMPAGEDGSVKAIPVAEDRPHKKGPASMVPLLSRRSIFILLIGLLIGMGLGGGYWLISPTLAEISESAQSSNLGQPKDGPHTCTINTKIVSQSDEYNTVKDLQREGEYYATRMSGIKFFEFLSQSLDESSQGYTYSPEELAEIISIRYDWNSEFPALKITVTGVSADEAVSLTSFTAGVLNNFLITEQEDSRLREIQSKTAQKEAIKAEIIEAEKKLANLKLQGGYDLDLNPDYTVLTAKLDALEAELDVRAADLAILVADGNTGREYLEASDAMKRTSRALTEVKTELSNLEAELVLNYTEEKLAYSKAEADIQNLNNQLNGLDERLTYLATVNVKDSILISFDTFGGPSEPTPVLVDRVRGRTALMMGAVLGIGLAWVILNRRWLVSTLASSTVGAPENNEEDEE